MQQHQSILYGINGEGMGHATRSEVMINFLIEQGYNIVATASDRAYDYLYKNFKNHPQVTILKTVGLNINYKDNKLVYSKTILDNVKKVVDLPQNAKAVLKLKKFKIGLVISDFDSLSYAYGKLKRKPIIALDNNQIIEAAEHKYIVPFAYLKEFDVIKSFTKLRRPLCNHYLITTFFHPKLTQSKAEYFPPILRPQVLEIKPSLKNHIFVYQTSNTSKKNLLNTLSNFKNQKFIVYGLREKFIYKNIYSKDFSQTGVLKDLASAQAVITNGGFSLLSEALYYQKPCLVIPVKKQTEQLISALYIDKLRYGRFTQELTNEALKLFINEIPLYRQFLKKFKFGNNKAVQVRLLELVKQYLD